MTFLANPCCRTFDASVEENMIYERELELGGQKFAVYLLHPYEGDESRVIYYCPFCGQPVGEGLAAKHQLAALAKAKHSQGET